MPRELAGVSTNMLKWAKSPNGVVTVVESWQYLRISPSSGPVACKACR